MRSPSRITKWLGTTSRPLFSAYCIAAAFGTYFCMYGFRKPFTAGTYDVGKIGQIDYKAFLVAAQVAGYALAKCLGIKFVSEITPSRRGPMILLLIGSAELALGLFAVTPGPWNVVFLFFNGLSLGMVFGLVLGYLEGRQLTEALAAGLCASFIVASGVTKSVGRWLMEERGVPEHWMPFVTGALFALPLFGFVWLLRQIPRPTQLDEKRRAPRPQMSRLDRWAFFQKHCLGLIGLMLVYVLLTLMRSIRDDFAVEIWRDMDYDAKPAVFTQTELLVMIGVVAINGAAIMLKSNRTALLSTLVLCCGGFVLILGSIVAYRQEWISAFYFMVLIGLGAYVPYVAYHTTIFERLIAASRDKGNVGYLLYLADALGYVSYVIVMVMKNWISKEANYLQLFIWLTTPLAVFSIGALLLVLFHYRTKIPHDDPLDAGGEEVLERKESR